MADGRTYSLSEVARRLDVPQHRLIHLCEKGVVVPDVHDAAGRGSSRVFSERNFLELAVALRLRDMLLPIAAAGAVVHVLRRFEQQIQPGLDGCSLTGSLRKAQSPDLRVIISDGQTLYFSLGSAGECLKLFGGVPLDAAAGNGRTCTGSLQAVQPRPDQSIDFGGPERSQFARFELSVTAIAKELPLD
jgi:DNA-binding transcriptional MerR regulator